MITFIICVKHYENCHSYENTWELLKNTLISVCNQTDDNFDVIVVSNKILNDFADNPKIKNVKFIEVDWKPPTPSDAWQSYTQIPNKESRWHIKLDRGTKYILALNEVVKSECEENHYVMFVDADDFIHKKLVSYINKSNEDFLKIQKGFQLGVEGTYCNMNDFSQICGTANITRLEIIKEELSLSGINPRSNQKDIMKTTNDYYLKMIVGAHKWSYEHFTKKGYQGGTVPFPAAIYNCTHNEQHSGRGNDKFKNKLSTDMVNDFSIPLDTNLESEK